MKIGVISDTHDHLENISKAVTVFNNKNVDVLIHCGDYVSPFTFNVFDNLNEKDTKILYFIRISFFFKKWKNNK